ncbi:MAG TPA: hypothetical protein IAA02_01245, partial [Candidatus Sutterella merdavium]|nr:hypothetical protein [Candidatus Sutterella merdavium]
VHARAFTMHYWMSAHTLATHGETACAAVFGLSKDVCRALRAATPARIMSYCAEHPSVFHFSMEVKDLWHLLADFDQERPADAGESERFLERVLTLVHAGQPAEEVL